VLNDLRAEAIFDILREIGVFCKIWMRFDVFFKRRSVLGLCSCEVFCQRVV